MAGCAYWYLHLVIYIEILSPFLIMKNRNLLITVLIIIFILALWLWNRNNTVNYSPGENSFRDISHVILTNHAKCRMDCRHITMEEIKEIVQRGAENQAKSGFGNKGDHTYTLEGYTSEHQHLRVVVAPENDGLVVITCIDLNKSWPCNCD